MQVSTSPTNEIARYRTPYIEKGDHTLTLAQEASSESKTRSSLEVMEKDKPLRCGEDAEIIVKYTLVGEAQGTMELVYYVSNVKIRMGILMKPQEHVKSDECLLVTELNADYPG